MPEVDLEALAAGYAHRPASGESVRRYGEAWNAVGGAPGEVAVDIGGGPGHHAAEWARRGALAVVVDPAVGMVEAAGQRPGVRAVRGRAEAIPLRAESAVLAAFHWSLHHTRWRAALGEAARIVRPGGRLDIATQGPQDLARSHMARWFPSVPAVDGRRFPDPDAVAEHLARVGFEVVARERVAEPKERRAGDWTAAVEAGFVSTVQLLPGSEVAAGLSRFRERYPDPDTIVRYSVFYEHLAATRRR